MTTYYIVAHGTAALPNEIDAGSKIDLNSPPYASGDTFVFRGSADRDTAIEDSGLIAKSASIQFEEDSTGGGYTVSVTNAVSADIKIDDTVDISDVNFDATNAGHMSLTGGDGVSIGGYTGSNKGNDTISLGTKASINGDILTQTLRDAKIIIGDGYDLNGYSIVTGNGDEAVTLGDVSASNVDALTIDLGEGGDTLHLGEIDPSLANIISTGDDKQMDELHLEVSDPADKTSLEAALTTAGYTQSGKTWTSPDGAGPTVTDVKWGNTLIENTESVTVVCFARGTRIETDQGGCPIEDLAPGDLVRTLDHGMCPIQWIGSTTVPAIGTLAPVRIKAGALGNTRDLVVSPQHRMMLSGWQMELFFGEPEVLASAKSLVNDTTIRREPGGIVQYFHMLFEDHEIVFAEGAPSESFYPGKEAMDAVSQATRDEILQLFPELAHGFENFGPHARMNLRGSESHLAVHALSHVHDLGLAKFH